MKTKQNNTIEATYGVTLGTKGIFRDSHFVSICLANFCHIAWMLWAYISSLQHVWVAFYFNLNLQC